MHRIKLLAPLRHRRYRLLATGSLVSQVGDGIFLVALPLLVYGIANVPTAMALVGAVWTTSQVSLLLVGGGASDRFDRRRIMIAADVGRAAAVGAMGVLALTDTIALWHVWALGSVVGACNAFFNPSLAAIVPELLPDRYLTGANALMGVARPALQRTIGPAVGGLAIGLWGPPGALLLDAATFLVSAGYLARMGAAEQHADAGRPDSPATGADASADAFAGTSTGGAATSQRLHLTEGLRYVLANRWAWAWMVAAGLALTAFTGPVDMLLPFVLLNDMGLGEREAGYALSVVLATGGIGAMAAAAAVGQLDLPRRFLTVMYLVQAAGVAALAVYGLMTAVWQAMVAALVIGASFAFADVVWVTVLQRFVPRHLLGRVAGVDWLTALGLMPVSFALAGPLATAFGARQVLVGGALLGCLAVLGLLALPGTRSLEQQAPDWRYPDPSDPHRSAPNPSDVQRTARGGAGGSEGGSRSAGVGSRSDVPR